MGMDQGNGAIRALIATVQSVWRGLAKAGPEAWLSVWARRVFGGFCRAAAIAAR